MGPLQPEVPQMLSFSAVTDLFPSWYSVLHSAAVSPTIRATEHWAQLVLYLYLIYV